MFKILRWILVASVILIMSACGGGSDSRSGVSSGLGSDVNSSLGGGSENADTSKPIITLIGDTTITLTVGDTYTDAGATAFDNVDGNITVNITTNYPVDVNTTGTYTVTYDVNDTAGNVATQVTRTVIVNDTTPPVITILGVNPASAVQFETYTDAGATAEDAVEGNVTVTTTGSVDSDAVGSYTITYTATDSADNNVTAQRTVNVTTKHKLKKTGQSKSYDAKGNEVTNESIKDDGHYKKGITPNYTRNDTTNIVTDHITELEWQDDVEAKKVRKTWFNAQNYCQDLGLDGGRWRLPSRTELVGLSDYGRNKLAINPIFSNVGSYGYWSSTTYAGDSSNAWNVYFNSNGQYYNGKGYRIYVRCVRVGQ